MRGQEDNGGFLATESGVKQFQLSLWGCFILRCHRFFPELRLMNQPKQTENPQRSIKT
jgi:hypothetical protein